MGNLARAAHETGTARRQAPPLTWRHRYLRGCSGARWSCAQGWWCGWGEDWWCRPGGAVAEGSWAAAGCRLRPGAAGPGSRRSWTACGSASLRPGQPQPQVRAGDMPRNGRCRRQAPWAQASCPQPWWESRRAAGERCGCGMLG